MQKFNRFATGSSGHRSYWIQAELSTCPVLYQNPKNTSKLFQSFLKMNSYFAVTNFAVSGLLQLDGVTRPEYQYVLGCLKSSQNVETDR